MPGPTHRLVRAVFRLTNAAKLRQTMPQIRLAKPAGSELDLHPDRGLEPRDLLGKPSGFQRPIAITLPPCVRVHHLTFRVWDQNRAEIILPIGPFFQIALSPPRSYKSPPPRCRELSDPRAHASSGGCRRDRGSTCSPHRDTQRSGRPAGGLKFPRAALDRSPPVLCSRWP